MAYDELVYYDLSTDIAYREDQSEIANDNIPEFKYKLEKALAVQFLDSDSVDANADFNDFADESAVSAASASIDNNHDHYEDGAASAAYTIGGAPYSKVTLKNITELSPRAAGRIKFTKAGGDTETIKYNGVSPGATGIYTFTCADANYDADPWTPSFNFAADDVARYIENPIVLDSSVDITDKATGLFVATMDCNNVIAQDLTEGVAEIEDCTFELKLLDGSANLIKAKEFSIRFLSLQDDDGEEAPAPEDAYSTTAENAALFDGLIKHYISATIDGTSLGDTTIQTISANKRFLPTRAIEVLDAISGGGDPASFKIKVGAADLMPARALAMTVAEKCEFDELDTDEFFAAAAIVKAEITNASTYTTYDIKVIIEGVLIDA